MADRRMFSKNIIDSDAFLDMPLSAQALYFHLSMRADDDGFISNPKRIQRMINSSDDDLRLLMAKRFIIGFESGVIVIKHWKIHNYIRNDRYKPTLYQEEKAMLAEKENKAYSIGNPPIPAKQNLGIPSDNQTVYQRETQVRLGKVRLGKVNKDILSDKSDPAPFAEIIGYLNEKANTKFKTSTKSTQTKIKARLAEGFTVDDFKKVIDIKTAEWLNDADMQGYLRPDTLFGTKFEGYLNQKQPMRKSVQRQGYERPVKRESVPDWSQEQVSSDPTRREEIDKMMNEFFIEEENK